MTPGGQTASLREYVAEEIRALLARRMANGAKLAAALGKSEMYVSRRLRGETAFDVDDLEKIAGFLGVEVTDLLPRPTEGRVLTTIGSHPSTPNAGSGRSAVRGTRTRTPRKGQPIGGARKDATAPASANAVTQRRPMLVSAPGQRIAA